MNEVTDGRVDKERVRDLLEQHHLSHVADRVVAAMKPSIFLSLVPQGGSMYDRVPRPETIPVGVSKVGGSPDLPPAFQWPEWNGEPLSFLAQIALPEVAAFDVEGLLPRTGMLYFFCDSTMEWLMSEDAEETIQFVHYAEDVSALERDEASVSRREECDVFTPCLIAFRRQWTVPNRSCAEIESLALMGEEEQRYWEAWMLWDEQQPRPPLHRMLGCPDVMYNDGRYGCVSTETVTSEEWNSPGYIPAWVKRWGPEAGRCLPLFQIDTDRAAGLNWGDAGFIYYFIRPDDLQARRFNRVNATHEGH